MRGALYGFRFAAAADMFTIMTVGRFARGSGR
jgi:hypothetical protein